jgi:hypothetical protein
MNPFFEPDLPAVGHDARAVATIAGRGWPVVQRARIGVRGFILQRFLQRFCYSSRYSSGSGVFCYSS